MTAALAGPTGSIDWLPVPRFDGESIFGRLLDRHAGGYFSLEPDTPVPTHQRYLHDGLCLETTFDLPEGPATVRAWLSIGLTALWFDCRTPRPLRLTCRPGFSYGAVRPSYHPVPNGMRFLNPRGPEQAQLLMQGPFQVTDRIDQWMVGPGEITLVFRVTTESPANTRWLTRPIPSDPERQWEQSARYWLSGRLPYEGPQQDIFHRSVDILRGLTYRPSGAPIAAATTSLPEIPGEARQWDYRYVWVRDSAYAAEALLMAGDRVASRRIAEFLLNTVSTTERVFPAPFFRVDGTLPDGERDLLWLQGHDESRPARAGNGAIHQIQLDLAGSVLWLVYHLWRGGEDLSFIRQYWWAIEALSDWAQHTWTQQDASLWEYRTMRGLHTHSRMMNWVGLTAGARMAHALGHTTQVTRWSRAANRIRDMLLGEAQSLGFYPTRQGGGAPDASLLTLPLYDLVSVNQVGFLNTLSQIESHLVHDDMVYRYREDEFGAARYPFLLAGFWYARILLRLGRLEDADRVIARHVSQATPLGLFGEHGDSATGQVRGNFPQLFSHTGLIAALMERQRLVEGRPLLSFNAADDKDS